MPQAQTFTAHDLISVIAEGATPDEVLTEALSIDGFVNQNYQFQLDEGADEDEETDDEE